MRRVLNGNHIDSLQACELIEHVEKLGDAEVLLHLIFAYELHIVKDKLLDAASEVFTVGADTLVSEDCHCAGRLSILALFALFC